MKTFMGIMGVGLALFLAGRNVRYNPIPLPDVSRVEFNFGNPSNSLTKKLSSYYDQSGFPTLAGNVFNDNLVIDGTSISMFLHSANDFVSFSLERDSHIVYLTDLASDGVVDDIQYEFIGNDHNDVFGIHSRVIATPSVPANMLERHILELFIEKTMKFNHSYASILERVNHWNTGLVSGLEEEISSYNIAARSTRDTESSH